MKCYYVEEGGYVLHRSIQGYLKLDLSGSQPDRERQNFSTCAVRFYNYTTKLGAQIQ